MNMILLINKHTVSHGKINRHFNVELLGKIYKPYYLVIVFKMHKQAMTRNIDLHSNLLFEK